MGVVSLVLALLSMACVNEANERNKAGVTLENVGAMEEAIVELGEAIRADPEFILAYYNRGQANFKLGRFDEAIDDYDQAVSLDPESSLFYTKRGDAYLGLGQYEKAVQEQNQVLSRDPGFALAYYSRGGAYFELGRRAEAIQDYNQAVEIDHRLGITNDVGARCAFYDDLYPKDVAYRDCRGFSSHASRFATAFKQRGFENFDNGEYRKAIQDYDQAIRLDSDSDLYNNRGLAYQGLGLFDEAFQDFEIALGKFGYAPAHYNQAKLLYELGEYQVAVIDYSRAISLDPLFADSYGGRALAYTRLERDKDAKLDIDRAVELGVDRAELEGAIQELQKQR